MDGIIAYALSKSFTKKAISELGSVLTFKGVVNTYSDLPTTGNKTGDVYSVRDTGNEYVWVNEGWELLGSSIGAGKYSTTITGDGTTADFTITHNLNTKDYAVLVYGSDNKDVLVDINRSSTTACVLSFNSAPAVGEVYTVSCLVPQGPQGIKGDTGDAGFSPSATVSKVGRTATITITDEDGTTTATVNDGNDSVSVSGTGTSTNDVRYITIDGTESRFTSVALRAMKSAWVTGTTSAAATAILNDDSVVAGDGFLATVYWSDLPGDLTQAEVKAFVMKKSGSYQKIIQFECTSGTVAPYSWFYNSYEGVWRSQVPLNNTVTSTSTSEALTANMGKALQDQVNNLKNIGRFLAIWDSSTGLPLTNPTTMPYTYRTGDYYRVGTVSSATPAVNYKPNGATYDGTASTTVETESVEVGWVYYYDGTQWLAQSAGGGGTVQDVQVNGTSILSSETGVANIPIAGANLGVMKAGSGLSINGTTGAISVNKASNSAIEGKVEAYNPIVPSNLDKSVMEGLGNNSLTWSDAYKTAARTTIGAAAPTAIEFLGESDS